MNQTSPLQNKPIPLIICGLPKSGTTLLVSLLDGHPELMVFPLQSHFVANIAKDNLPAQTIETLIDKLGIDTILSSSDELAKLKEHSSELWNNSNKTVSDMYQCLFQAYSRLNQPEKKWNEYLYYSEKTTRSENLLSAYLKRTNSQFKAIYIVRDPLDNFASWRERWKKHNKKDLTIFEFLYNQFLSIYAWQKLSHDNSKFLLISYEDLVSNPSDTSKKIAQFLQIDWNESLLIPTQNKQLWTGNSTNNIKFEGISNVSVGSYKKRLALKEISILCATRELLYQKILNSESSKSNRLIATLKIHITLLKSLCQRDANLIEYLHSIKLFFQTLNSLKK